MAQTVMVVDDSPTMVLSLKTSLGMNHYQVETAGKEAIDKLKAGTRPDLIITDVNMPVMGGMDLIREVRAMAALRFVPILILTTEGDATKREEGKRLGATGWLVKPVSGDDLLRVLKKVLPGA